MDLNYDGFLSQLKNDNIINSQGKLFEFGTVKTTFNSAFDGSIPYAFNEYCTSQKVYFAVNSPNDWLDKGVECKILQAGSSGWKSGRIKINVTVEFIPDEPNSTQYQSPLDEIRQGIEKINNQE